MINIIKDHYGIFIGLALSLVWSLGAFAVYGGWLSFVRVSPHGITINELGDFLAGWFAPMAFAWFVYTAITQRRELEAARTAYQEHTQVGNKAAKQAQIDTVRQLLDEFLERNADEIEWLKNIDRKIGLEFKKKENKFQIKMKIFRKGVALPAWRGIALLKCLSLIDENNDVLAACLRQSLHDEYYHTYAQRYCDMISGFHTFKLQLEQSYDEDVLGLLSQTSNFYKIFTELKIGCELLIILTYQPTDEGSTVCVNSSDASDPIWTYLNDEVASL